jgi:hypothetical protein
LCRHMHAVTYVNMNCKIKIIFLPNCLCSSLHDYYLLHSKTSPTLKSSSRKTFPMELRIQEEEYAVLLDNYQL